MAPQSNGCLLTKAPVLIHTSFNDKNGPQGPAFVIGRGRGIRTPDIQLPKLALYQTELYPETPPTARKHAGQAMVRSPARAGQRTQTVVPETKKPTTTRRLLR